MIKAWELCNKKYTLKCLIYTQKYRYYLTSLVFDKQLYSKEILSSFQDNHPPPLSEIQEFFPKYFPTVFL